MKSGREIAATFETKIDVQLGLEIDFEVNSCVTQIKKNLTASKMIKDRSTTHRMGIAAFDQRKSVTRAMR